jgi:RNA polymerase subunit RPABC4/transcription elongation factor Spt4
MKELLYCDRCNVSTQEKVCPSCGNNRLRAVTTEDFCYFVSLEQEKFNRLESALKENGIDVVGVPFFMNGPTYANAGRPNGRKAYIRYKNTEKAKEIYRTVFGEEIPEP